MEHELVENGDRWKDGRGELTITRPSGRVVVFDERGYLSAEFAEPITKAMDHSITRIGKPFLFVDGQFLDGYDSKVRTRASDWVRDHRHQIEVQHMLVQSRIAKMGLSVVSLLLGGVIVGHHERSSFDAALEVAIRESSATVLQVG